jgi:hypothetical protein
MRADVPPEIRQAFENFVALCDAEIDVAGLEEIVLLGVAWAHASAARDGKTPPEWVARLPCFPPNAADLSRVLEFIRPAMQRWPRGREWIEETEGMIRELVGQAVAGAEDESSGRTGETADPAVIPHPLFHECP